MGCLGEEPKVPATRETGVCPYCVATCRYVITSEYQAELASEWLGSQVSERQLIWDGCWTDQSVYESDAGGTRRSKAERPVCMCVSLCEAAEGERSQGSVTQ